MTKTTETSTIVRLIRHRSGFTNIADSFSVIAREADPAIDEVSEELSSYVLPADYCLSETILGDAAIYDPDGRHCEVVPHSCGRPQLVSEFRGPAPVLNLHR